MLQFLVIALFLQQSLCQLGQDDADYTDQYEPDIVDVTDEGTTSGLSSSNLKKFVPQEDAQNCVDTNCAEEIVACKHNEDCFGNYGRFEICYNQTLSFKNCKEPLLNSTLSTVTFELQDLMECYNLCGWSKTKGLNGFLLCVVFGLDLLLF
ncbi:unnamed protein product [Paramecium octaurelia]|uniref:Uncharacterized protein n=1 Tax=Paramecium octaurelia TaxID=43137 RepID=A0A8S1THG9_PAROT|nr:unnamed protein product [Paramecium octaurelia]